MRPMLLFDKHDIEMILTGQVLTIHTGGSPSVLVTLDPELKRKKFPSFEKDREQVKKPTPMFACRHCGRECGTAGGRGMHEKVHRKNRKALVAP